MKDQKTISLPNALYPFELQDLMRFDHDGYTLHNVFTKISDAQRQACVELWLRNRVLPSAEAAWARTDQVCYFITNANNNELVGVNTLYQDSLQPGGATFWMNRMFLDPKARSGRLMITGTALMLCYAKTHLSDQGAGGVVNVNENRKLSRPGMAKIFQRLGYQKIGHQHGNEVLLFDFARINFL